MGGFSEKQISNLKNEEDEALFPLRPESPGPEQQLPPLEVPHFSFVYHSPHLPLLLHSKLLVEWELKI